MVYTKNVCIIADPHSGLEGGWPGHGISVTENAVRTRPATELRVFRRADRLDVSLGQVRPMFALLPVPNFFPPTVRAMAWL